MAAKGFTFRPSRQTELGVEVRCSHCKEFFPADREFFYPDKKSPWGVHSWCKACFEDSATHHKTQRKWALRRKLKIHFQKQFPSSFN